MVNHAEESIISYDMDLVFTFCSFPAVEPGKYCPLIAEYLETWNGRRLYMHR